LIDKDINLTKKLTLSYSKTIWLAINVFNRLDAVKADIHDYVSSLGRIYFLVPIY